MEQRVVTTVERSYSATVNDIEHIESQSLDGVAVIKVFFQPTADVATGIAELTAASQSKHADSAAGDHAAHHPPVQRDRCADLQIGVGSSTMSQADLNDYVSNFVRTPLATAQGSTIPFPYGGAPAHQRGSRFGAALCKGALAIRRERCRQRGKRDPAAGSAAWGPGNTACG